MRVARAAAARTWRRRRGRWRRCRSRGPCGARIIADGVGDDVEVAQAEEVHLQQPELLDAVHLVLRDDRGVFGVAARSRACAGSAGTW